VAINTWQIQLLKPRMTAAEEKIAQLELEISSLKSELENLKKS
jgi:predicted  nucleic acid-binding Zn-ribbon protein